MVLSLIYMWSFPQLMRIPPVTSHQSSLRLFLHVHVISGANQNWNWISLTAFSSLFQYFPLFYSNTFVSSILQSPVWHTPCTKLLSPLFVISVRHLNFQ